MTLQELLEKIEDLELRVEELEDKAENMNRSIIDLESDLGQMMFDDD